MRPDHRCARGERIDRLRSRRASLARDVVPGTMTAPVAAPGAHVGPALAASALRRRRPRPSPEVGLGREPRRYGRAYLMA